MLFKTRKNIRKDYINTEIEKEISEKWFAVYNYISLKELFLTVQRDYLNILSKINLPFWIITIILWVIWYIWNSFSLFFWFLFLVYLIIFGILAVKLVFRAYYFMQITDVVYTENWIILANELHKYKEENKLLEKLEEYSEMFDEFLSKPSKIQKIIERKKRENLENNLELAWKTLGHIWDLWEDWIKLAIPVMLSHFAYVMLLYFFYYFWYFFWIIIFFIINIFLKIILKFTKNTQVKIKWRIEDIDDSFKNMDKIEKILSNKINNFKDWEISNISKDVEKNFSNFYTEVISVFNEKKKLLKLINNSKFKDFVNFEKLEKYLKNSFNKPVLEMLSMLEKFEKLLEKQINLLKITNSNSEILDLNVQKKEIILTTQLNNLRKNKNKLEKSLI